MLAHRADVSVGTTGVSAGMITPDLTIWRFLVGVYNGTGLRYYLNGTLVDSANIVMTERYFNTTLGQRGAMGSFYSGDIDQLTIWNRSLSAAEVTELWNGGAGTPYLVNLTTVNLISPADNALTSSHTIIFNATSTPNPDSSNANITLHLYNSTALFNKTTNLLSGTSINGSIWTLNNLPIGVYTWNAFACSVANICGFAESNYTFTIGSSLFKNYYSNNTFETYRDLFQINLSIPSSTTLSSANLFYEGTAYAGTISLIAGNNYSLTRLLDIPTQTAITEVNTFFWSLNYNTGVQENLTSTTHNSNATFFSLCNATLATRYLNISFLDESDLSSVNATIPSSTFTWWLGGQNTNKSITFVNNTANKNYVFCASPNYYTFNVLPYVQYAATGYPQRIWQPSSAIVLTNVTTNKTLYLLSTSAGQYVTFQIVNPSNQVLEGVTVTAARDISGVSVIIATGITGADGSVTFFLNPDFSHDFTFTKDGFDTLESSFAPTQTGYTITLGGATATEVNDYTSGITASVKPVSGARLFNGTTYNFNLTITSSFWSLSEFGFRLKTTNGTILASVNATTNGGFVSTNLNTANHTRIIMQYYWIVNGSTINQNAYWNIMNTGYSGFGIMTFFSDLDRYIDSGIFGLDNFGKNLILFIILFTFVGVMSFKYGLYNPIGVSTIIFAVVMFFDWGVGLIDTSDAVIPYFPTFIAGLILVAALFREGTQ